MDKFVSANHRRCIRLFESLTKVDSAIALYLDDGTKAAIRNEFDRYRVWAINVGAGFAGEDYQRSLDYRFRKAPAYKDQIVHILERIEELLDRCLRMSTPIQNSAPDEDTDPFVDEEDVCKTDDHQDEGDIPSWSSTDSEDQSSDDENEKFGMLQLSRRFRAYQDGKALHYSVSGEQQRDLMIRETVDSLHLSITCLYKIPIRTAAPLSQQNLRNSAVDELARAHRSFDEAFVSDAYPSADKRLVSRLALGISRRRAWLRYRRERNERLQYEKNASTLIEESEGRIGQSITDAAPKILDFGPQTQGNQSQDNSSAILSTVKATTFIPTYPLPEPDGPMFDTFSEPETVSSFATTDAGDEKISLPKRPKDSSGEEMTDFECSFCCLIVHVRPGEHAWKKHIIKDFEPYQCTHVGCESPDLTYKNRKEWFDHEKRHRWFYQCNEPEHAPVSSLDEFRTHMSEFHHFNTTILSETQLAMFRKTAESLESMNCPLCNQFTSRMDHHLSRHLERIAFFALPRPPASETMSTALESLKMNDSDDSIPKLSIPIDEQGAPPDLEESPARSVDTGVSLSLSGHHEVQDTLSYRRLGERLNSSSQIINSPIPSLDYNRGYGNTGDWSMPSDYYRRQVFASEPRRLQVRDGLMAPSDHLRDVHAEPVEPARRGADPTQAESLATRALNRAKGWRDALVSIARGDRG